MRKFSKENIIVVCTIVLCFMLTIGLCSVFSGDGILSVVSFGKSDSEDVYAVAVGGYTDMTLARATADLIKGRGGAGYIVDGDTIEIIYAVYYDEDTAKSVQAALGESGTYVKQISIKSSKLKWAGDLKSAVQAALGYYKLAFDGLYETANNLSDSTIEKQDAITQIQVLTSQIEDIKAVFYQKAADSDSPQITEVKLALITAIALLQNIKRTDNTAQFVSSIRYALVQLVMCRQALMNSI